MTVIETEPTVAPIEVVEPTEAQRILLAARDYIADESKWCTGELEDSQGRVCAIGAVARLIDVDDHGGIYDSVERHPAGRFLVLAAAEGFGGAWDHDELTADVIYEFNDERGHREVMRMFNRAIELAGKA